MSGPAQPGATPPPANPPANPPAQPPTPNPPATPPADQNVDLSKLDAAQLEKVLENPNLWHLPRIKELREAKTAHDKLLADQKAAEEKSMEEQNKHKELAEKRSSELATAQETIKTMTINQALTSKLVPLGVVDLDGALKLVDRSKLSVDEAGNITGLDSAIESLKTDKAYLFNTSGGGQPTLGAPTNGNQPNNGQPMKFKRSQLSDHKFYQEHRDEILAAQKAGLIDMNA